MSKDVSKLEGLLKWSLAQTDGTGSARNLSEEERQWFMDAMQAQTVDVVKRMKEITLLMKTPEDVLQAQGVTASDIEGLLDELMEHVESIDMANDLHSIGGLVPLLGFLKNSDAGIRAKAAEVVTTIVQNNPKCQQLVIDSNGMDPLLSNFTSDPDIIVRTKALGTISSLIRNFKPGLVVFKLANGFAGLRDALGSDDVRFQRKALNLTQYLLEESESGRDAATDLGLGRQMLHLAGSHDADVREAALRALLGLAREPAKPTFDTEDTKKLRQLLEGRAVSIAQMGPEDLSAAREEHHLVHDLWAAFFPGPSSLPHPGPEACSPLAHDTLTPSALPQPGSTAHPPPPADIKSSPPLLLSGPPQT
ncbi:hsp70 nucleotide exchange factor fes1-like [Wolffia australiana]